MMCRRLTIEYLQVSRQFRSFVRLVLGGSTCIAAITSLYAQQTAQIKIQWDKTVMISKSTPTLQVVVNPLLRPGEPLSAASYKALKELGADYVRYVPWLPYPRLAVAELEPPTPQKTSWDFSVIDPMTKDFFAATEGHSTVMNFSTMPTWLFKTDKPVTYPADPNAPFWNYTQGTELRDPTGKEVSDYYERLVSWYVKGGFTDENGVRHESGYHYKLPIWEVLNEVDAEHSMTPEDYTRRYDFIVEGIHRASPTTKFMGLALAAPRDRPDFFEYFLNPANHKPGIPLDYISYHFYATPTRSQTIDDWQYTFFDQAEGFLSTVRYAESIRKRLSPTTKTDLNELGVILPTDNTAADKVPPPAGYYNLAGSLYAYLYIELLRLQIDVIGESQLVGYPTQYPSVSMMDWITNKPNPRFWVLKLIKDNFHPGDKIVDTNLGGPASGEVEAQAFITPAGHKLLLANKRNQAIEIKFPDAQNASALTVDESTGDEPPAKMKLVDSRIVLNPFSVMVISW